jgi:hypothetical protein
MKLGVIFDEVVKSQKERERERVSVKRWQRAGG